MHPWGRTAGDAHAGMHSCTLSFRGHRSSQTDPPPSHPQPRSAGAPPAPPQAHSHQQPGPQPPPPVLTQFLKRENDRSSCPAPPAHHRLQLRAQHRGSNTATPPLPHPPPPPHPDAVHPPKQRTDAFPTAPVGSPRIPAVPFRAGPRGGVGNEMGGRGAVPSVQSGTPRAPLRPSAGCHPRAPHPSPAQHRVATATASRRNRLQPSAEGVREPPAASREEEEEEVEEEEEEDATPAARLCCGRPPPQELLWWGGVAGGSPGGGVPRGDPRVLDSSGCWVPAGSRDPGVMGTPLGTLWCWGALWGLGIPRCWVPTGSRDP